MSEQKYWWIINVSEIGKWAVFNTESEARKELRHATDFADGNLRPARIDDPHDAELISEVKRATARMAHAARKRNTKRPAIKWETRCVRCELPQGVVQVGHAFIVGDDGLEWQFNIGGVNVEIRGRRATFTEAKQAAITEARKLGWIK